MRIVAMRNKKFQQHDRKHDRDTNRQSNGDKAMATKHKAQAGEARLSKPLVIVTS